MNGLCSGKLTCIGSDVRCVNLSPLVRNRQRDVTWLYGQLPAHGVIWIGQQKNLWRSRRSGNFLQEGGKNYERYSIAGSKQPLRLP